MIRTFTNPKDIVLDNACGSGSFLVSAVLEDRDFIGIELNKENILHHKHKIDMIKVCNERIEKANQQFNNEKIQRKLGEEDKKPKNGEIFTLYMPLLP